MTITELLHCRAMDLAQKLDVPIGFEGESFVVPASPHLRCRIDPGKAKAAALGANAPTRLDGALEITAVSMAGSGMAEVAALSAKVAKEFPRGSGLDYDGEYGSGELVFSAPHTMDAQADSGRVSQTVKLGFYAIIFPKEKQ